jgi:hypothetical protein
MLSPGQAFLYLKVVPCCGTVQPSISMARFGLAVRWTPPLFSHCHYNSLPVRLL